MNSNQAINPIDYINLDQTGARELFNRSQAAMDEAMKWQALWQRVMNLVAPNNNNYWNSAGTKKRYNVYDNSAYYYANTYAAQFIASGFTPRTKWCSFTPSWQMVRTHMERNGDDLNSDKAWNSARNYLKRGLAKISDRCFDLIFDSNFDEITPSWVKNYEITDAFMRIDRDRYRGGGVTFFNAPLGSYGFEIDNFMNIWGVYYCTSMTVGNARLQWDLVNVPASVNEKTKVNLVECYVKEGNRWKFVVLMSPGSTTQNGAGASIVTKPKYYQFCPWAILRGPSVPSEIWSRGILVNCLQDIERINNEKYLDIINRELATHTSFMYRDDGSINPSTFKLGPGSLIKVRSTGGTNGPSLMPITMPYNLAARQDSREESHSDLVRNILGDPMMNKDRNSYQSATEWLDRQRFDQIRHGVNYGAINNAAKSVLMSVSEIMLGDEGMMDMPDELDAFASMGELSNLGVQLESPISKMYNSQQVESLLGIVQIASSIAPELVQRTMNVPEIPLWLADKMGVPQDPLFKSESDQEEEAYQAGQLEASSNPANSVIPIRSGAL